MGWHMFTVDHNSISSYVTLFFNFAHNENESYSQEPQLTLDSCVKGEKRKAPRFSGLQPWTPADHGIESAIAFLDHFKLLAFFPRSRKFVCLHFSHRDILVFTWLLTELKRDWQPFTEPVSHCAVSSGLRGPLPVHSHTRNRLFTYI